MRVTCGKCKEYLYHTESDLGKQGTDWCVVRSSSFPIFAGPRDFIVLSIRVWGDGGLTFAVGCPYRHGDPVASRLLQTYLWGGGEGRMDCVHHRPTGGMDPFSD